jgi:hypothetical protein
MSQINVSYDPKLTDEKISMGINLLFSNKNFKYKFFIYLYDDRENILNELQIFLTKCIDQKNSSFIHYIINKKFNTQEIFYDNGTWIFTTTFNGQSDGEFSSSFEIQSFNIAQYLLQNIDHYKSHVKHEYDDMYEDNELYTKPMLSNLPIEWSSINK